jgi:hypothetical protein
MSEQELERLTRDELNARAEQLGVADPAGLPNKAAVVAAIVQAEGGAGTGPRSLTARRAALLRRRRARGQL